MYVFDTSAFLDLNKFYPKRFPTLWSAVEDLIAAQKILSVKEALRELQNKDDFIAEWAKNREEIFCVPDEQEARFVSTIYQVRHFQFGVEKRKMLNGGYIADPFIVAKAKVLGRTVVTNEKIKENAAKIPNICKHFEIECLDFEGFMELEDLVF
jgi:hypothetical protein